MRDLQLEQTNKLYDSIYTCPLSVYIDAVVDDKLESLIISGNPTREYLEEVKIKLVSDFIELSGGGDMKAFIEATSDFYAKRSIALGFDIAIRLINARRYKKAIEFLDANGMNCSIPRNEDEHEKLIAAVGVKFKNRLAKHKEATGKYKDMISDRREKPTRKYYNKLLVTLSTCEVIKIQLNPKTMTVAEFAEYINTYKEYQNNLKIKLYGRK